jgi:hypothetical protein
LFVLTDLQLFLYPGTFKSSKKDISSGNDHAHFLL